MVHNDVELPRKKESTSSLFSSSSNIMTALENPYPNIMFYTIPDI